MSQGTPLVVPVVKNLPCNTGGAGVIPGWETKIPRAAEQLSPSTENTKAACCN